MKQGKPAVLPGDKVAVSEEFLPGANAYDDWGLIRSLVVGTVNEDREKREIGVRPSARSKVLSVGDYITGQVEAAGGSSAGIRVYFVNGKPSTKGFSGSLMLPRGPPGRGARRVGPAVKLGDIVRAKIHSRMNGIIHLNINEDKTGVLYALCGNCGRPLTRAGDKLKCDECGNVEDRKLASDYGQTPIEP